MVCAVWLIVGIFMNIMDLAGDDQLLPKGPAFPVMKAKFHRYENLRAGRIKTERGWNVADFAMSVFNPSLTKPTMSLFTPISCWFRT